MFRLRPTASASTARILLSICFAFAPAFGQALSGTIVGTVTDESGAAIAGVSITLRNIETGFSRAVSTNSLGQYVAATIPTGTYSVTAEKTGFGKLLRDGLQLTAADTATVNLTSGWVM